MANELKVNLGVEYKKAGTNIKKHISKSITVSGSYPLHNRVSVGTTEEALSTGDVSTAGYLYIENKDTTNYIEYGRSSGTGTGSYTNKLKAGEFAFHRVSGTDALYAKANTSACDVEYFILED